MTPFDYPETPHTRRHGPQGYAESTSYRPWLRDEFTFRCVYCLNRENWGRVTGEFDLDHFQPKSIHPDKKLEYDNLLYSCRCCNAAKSHQTVPDPTVVLTSGHVRVYPDGSIEGLSEEATRLIRKLGLDEEDYRFWRRIWIRNIELAQEYDEEYCALLMSFPENLPELARLRPPGGNSRPEGIEDSYFARRRRGELPETY